MGGESPIPNFRAGKGITSGQNTPRRDNVTYIESDIINEMIKKKF